MIKWCRSESADKGGALGKHRIPDYINSGSCHYEHVSACKHFLPYFARCPHRCRLHSKNCLPNALLGSVLIAEMRRSAPLSTGEKVWLNVEMTALVCFFFSARKVEIALSFFSIRFLVLQISCALVFKAPVHVFRPMTECLSVHLHVVSPLFPQSFWSPAQSSVYLQTETSKNVSKMVTSRVQNTVSYLQCAHRPAGWRIHHLIMNYPSLCMHMYNMSGLKLFLSLGLF